MAKKKEIDVHIDELKKLLKENKVVLGTEKTLKILQLGNAKKVFVSKNCPEIVKKDIEYYASLSQVPIISLKQPNDELGTICKKPFAVSVLCVSQ